MFIDARFKTLETVRMAIATVVYPVQQAALMPGQVPRVLENSSTPAPSCVRKTPGSRPICCRRRSLSRPTSPPGRRPERLQSCCKCHRRRTQGAGQSGSFIGRDPFSQKAFVERQVTQTFEPGSAVVDERGLLGQLTRVHPLFAEITLITEKDFAVPVKVERTGNRACCTDAVRARPNSVTSPAMSMSGGRHIAHLKHRRLYPANIRVGTIATVQRSAENPFAVIKCANCWPARSETVLVLKPDQPPRRALPLKSPKKAPAKTPMSFLHLPGFAAVQDRQAGGHPAGAKAMVCRADAGAWRSPPICCRCPDSRWRCPTSPWSCFAGQSTSPAGSGWAAWACGLLTDVGRPTCLASMRWHMPFLVFAAGYFHRRVLRFPALAAGAACAWLLLIAQAVVLVLRLHERRFAAECSTGTGQFQQRADLANHFRIAASMAAACALLLD